MQYLIIMFFGIIAQTACAQQTKKDSLIEVSVQNWGKKAMFLPENFWSENKSQEIINQIGAKEFQKVKTYSDSKNIPCEFLIFCGVKKREPEELYAELDRLHVYELATFKQYNSSWEYKGVYSVLSVPYNENENWNKGVRWDTIYFIIERTMVKQRPKI